MSTDRDRRGFPIVTRKIVRHGAAIIRFSDPRAGCLGGSSEIHLMQDKPVTLGEMAGVEITELYGLMGLTQRYVERRGSELGR